ncbi:MAG: SAM-dependent methyltransferase [Pseudomonadota bacterium]
MRTGEDSAAGRLTCIGLGTMLGAHLTPACRQVLDTADDVFVLASDCLVELWVQRMRPDAASLQPFYAEGRRRRETYRDMERAVCEPVRNGRHVCAAFYGHPGVFAQVAHAAIASLRAEGYQARMEPGISAEDCLYADLGLDPGRWGCQHYEASQLLFFRRRLDPTALLVLWQVAVAGDRQARRYATNTAHRALLVDRLLEDYPASHPVIVYEAPTTPLRRPRIERFPLADLASAALTMRTTLVLEPLHLPAIDHDRLARAAAIDADGPDHPPTGPRRRLRLVASRP